MGNLSQLARITESALSVLFAELACQSASRANKLIEQFPGFRAAKGIPDDKFWISRGVEMLTLCKQELSLCESSIQFDDELSE